MFIFSNAKVYNVVGVVFFLTSEFEQTKGALPATMLPL